MEMKFLNLTVDNAFDFCAVLDAVGVNNVIGVFDKDEINAMLKDSKGKDEKKKFSDIGVVIAMKAVGAVMKHMSSAREEIYAFFAGCTVWENNLPVTKDDLRNLSLAKFAKLLKDFAQKEDLQDFFSEVAEFVSTEQTSSENSSTEDTTTPEITLTAPSVTADLTGPLQPF